MCALKREETLVIGGHSRLGRSIRENSNDKIAYVCRRKDSSSNSTVIASYHQITASDLSGYKNIINLVGTNKPDASELENINVALPEHLAAEAKRAGVRNFFHISSFSVFGLAESIGRDTICKPCDAYGESKYRADQIIGKMSDADFHTCSIRLPMLYGASDSKLERLIGIWKRSRVIPVPDFAARRSMLSYNLAAKLLLSVTEQELPRMMNWADPEAFEFEKAARTMSQELGHQIWLWRTGLPVLQPLKWAAPRLYRSLYSSSFLEPEANDAIKMGAVSTLYHDIGQQMKEH